MTKLLVKARTVMIPALVILLIGLVTPGAQASPVEGCQPSNLNGQSVNLGLPRSPLLVPSTGKVPILVAVVDFTNARETQAPSASIQGFELQKVADFYRQSSYGKLNFEFTVVSEVLHLPVADTNINERTIGTQTSQVIPTNYPLTSYKGLLIITTGNSTYSSSSANAEIRVENGTGALTSFAVLAGVKPNENRWLSSPWLTVTHELGHMMGLMDLWNSQDANAWEGKTAAPFSLMNTGAGWNYAADFFAWEKYVLGWIDGCFNLSENMPRHPDEIEAWMASLR